MVKVSVILPVYNVEKYLRECLDSICGQTLREIEIICVDDGSTDSSLEILREYAQKDKRVSVLTQSNLYAGVARNHGMEKAKGRYFSFLDADDYFAPEMLERLYLEAEKSMLDIVFCRHIEYNEAENQYCHIDFSYRDSFIERKDLFSGMDLTYNGIFNICSGWAWDKLFRAEFVQECGYQYAATRSSNDGFFVYVLMSRAKRMALLDDKFITHRTGNSGSISAKHELGWMNGFRMWEMIWKELRRLGNYTFYERSLLNEIVEYMSWYPDSMQSGETYAKCIEYLRKEFEPKLGIMKKEKEYFWREKYYICYCGLLKEPVEHQLYQKITELRKSMEWQKIFLNQRRKWVFPFQSVPVGSEIILYGAGQIGREFAGQLAVTGFCKRVIWVDRNYEELRKEGMDVVGPEYVSQEKYDYVVIANKNQQEEIKRELLEGGVDEGKIVSFQNRN